MKKYFILLITLFIVGCVPSGFVYASEADSTNIRKDVQQIKNTNNGKRIFIAVDKYSKRHKVNPALVHAIIYVESTYNPNAKSKAGAQGLMQLTPITQKARGCSNPYNIEQNVKYGSLHLAGMLARYNGNEVYALASYNSGGARVDRYIKNGKPLPKDLQNYVTKVQKYKRVIQQEL